MSQYAGKGKWKGVVIVWTVVISILLATRFSFIQTEITDFAISVCGVQGGTKNANFLINEFWVALIPLAIGTFILWQRKQSFSEIRIYTPIRDKQYFFFLKKSFNKSRKRGLFFVYLLLKINHITK